MSILPQELEPISDHILFQFVDETSKGQRGAFKSKTDWGFELASSADDTTQSPRWVEVIGLGPDVSDEFHIGQIILVAPLMWTQQVEYNGVKFARTDGSKVLAVDDDT